MHDSAWIVASGDAPTLRRSDPPVELGARETSFCEVPLRFFVFVASEEERGDLDTSARDARKAPRWPGHLQSGRPSSSPAALGSEACEQRLVPGGVERVVWLVEDGWTAESDAAGPFHPRGILHASRVARAIRVAILRVRYQQGRQRDSDAARHARKTSASSRWRSPFRHRHASGYLHGMLPILRAR